MSDSRAAFLSPICDRFEDQWRSGARPHIEDYLPKSAEMDQLLLRELLLIELKYRSRGAERPVLEDYSQRFPDHLDLVHYALSRSDQPETKSLATEDAGVATAEIHGTAVDAGGTTKLKWIGDYELLEIIGRGGMGVVYRARQNSLNRIVALKMINSAEFATPHEVERFRAEAEAAARLDHPGIVPVFEVGQCNGRHFYSMAFVDGPSLAERLADGPFAARDAAQLVGRAAEIIHFTHSHGVIHRDLKPANILCHSDGRIQVSDFGLAKRLDDDTQRTRTGEIFGTPGYMPPEQARGDSARVGPTSDVYSLGAVLYALLTGRPPFAAASFTETLRQVLEAEVIAPRLLNSTVPIDLQTICLKCLSKEPSRRYFSAAELADDLTRWQNGRPILARPVGRAQRAWRWCRRNPVVAGLSAAVFVLLFATTVVSTVSAITIDSARDEAEANAVEARDHAVAERAQRRRAETAEAQALGDAKRASREADTANEVARFLKDLFRSSDPTGLQGVGFRKSEELSNSLLARTLLDAGSKQLQQRFLDRPLVKSRLADVIGDVYRSIGMYQQAEPLLSEALHVRQGVLLADHPEVAESLFHVAWLRHDLGQWVEAEDLYRQALRIRELHFGPDHIDVAAVKFNLAWLLSDSARDDEAETLFREVLRIRQRELGDRHQDVDITRIALTITLMDQGKNVAAMMMVSSSFKQKTDIARGFQLYSQAAVAKKQGNREKADPLYRELIEIARRNLGAHPLTAMVLGDFAGLLRDNQQWDEAEECIREALDIGRRVAPNHPFLIDALNDYGDALRKHGRFDEAEKIYQEALDKVRLRHPRDEGKEADLLNKLELARQEQ